jgi:hypothetical protein
VSDESQLDDDQQIQNIPHRPTQRYAVDLLNLLGVAKPSRMTNRVLNNKFRTIIQEIIDSVEPGSEVIFVTKHINMQAGGTFEGLFFDALSTFKCHHQFKMSVSLVTNDSDKSRDDRLVLILAGKDGTSISNDQYRDLEQHLEQLKFSAEHNWIGFVEFEDYHRKTKNKSRSETLKDYIETVSFTIQNTQTPENMLNARDRRSGFQ